MKNMAARSHRRILSTSDLNFFETFLDDLYYYFLPVFSRPLCTWPMEAAQAVHFQSIRMHRGIPLGHSLRCLLTRLLLGIFAACWYRDCNCRHFSSVNRSERNVNICASFTARRPCFESNPNLQGFCALSDA